MNEIGIRIFWGPWGGEFSPAPIVSVGETMVDFSPEAPSLVTEDEVWMITNGASQSVYSYYAKVPCSNSEDFVQVLVNFTMQRNQHLANKSPLELLESLRDQFCKLFIINLNARLPKMEKINAAFGQLLSGCKVEDCPWYVFEMEGLQPGAFRVEDRNQLDALMRFNAYPALAHVGHLELGFKCNTTVDINTKGESNTDKSVLPKKSWRERWSERRKEVIEKKNSERERLAKEENIIVSVEGEKVEKKSQDENRNGGEKRTGKKDVVAVNNDVACKKKEINMPPKYQVWVNGVAQNAYLQTESDRYEVRLPKCESFSFSLGRLKSLPNHIMQSSTGNTVVKLDQENQRILCEAKCVEGACYYHNVEFERWGSDGEAWAYFENNIGKTIHVYYQGNRWLGEKIESLNRKDYNKTLYVSPSIIDGFGFSISDVCSYISNKYIVRINAEKAERKVEREKEMHRWARSHAIDAINHKVTGFIFNDIFDDLDSSEQEIVKWFLNLKIKDIIQHVGFDRFIGNNKKSFKFDNWEQITTLYKECNNKQSQ